MKNYILLKSLLLLMGTLLTTTAAAHHPLDGAMPTNFFDGLLSGFGHPLIGLDHFAFIIAAGLLAWKLGAPVRLALSFIAATAVGSLVISSGFAISITEPMVLASVALVGILLAANKTPPVTHLQLFYAVAGFFHGCAYGGAVIGAESTPIGAYLLGFSIIQWAIILAAIKVVEWLNRGDQQANIAVARLVGAAVFGIAFSYVFEIAETTLLG